MKVMFSLGSKSCTHFTRASARGADSFNLNLAKGQLGTEGGGADERISLLHSTLSPNFSCY